MVKGESKAWFCNRDEGFLIIYFLIWITTEGYQDEEGDEFIGF
jgi:hypothetical protein